MSSLLSSSLKKAITMASLVVGPLALIACSDDAPPTKAVSSKVAAISAPKSSEPTVDDLNSPRRVKFSNPGIGKSEEYLDVLYPPTTFSLYHSLREWDESAEDLADSVSQSVPSDSKTADVFRLGQEYGGTQDAFKKRDLAKTIAEQTKIEADKVKGRVLVKYLADRNVGMGMPLTSYDFNTQSFKLDSCLFSDKLEYSDAERGRAYYYTGAEQERCFMRTSSGPLQFGFVGGSKVQIKVSDENIAKKIESIRDKVNIEIFGYVEEVERERVAGEFSRERRVLIVPQKVNILDEKGEILFEYTI